MGFGVVGELFLDGPTRAQPGLLNSSDAANNVIGRAFTISDGTDGSLPEVPSKMRAGGTGVFAGILAAPKSYASYGTANGGPLAPTLTLANNVTAEFVTMGTMVVTLAAPANIGDWVIYNTTTGVLATIAPFASVPGGSRRISGAEVDRYNAGSGLAVITLQTFNSEPAST